MKNFLIVALFDKSHTADMLGNWNLQCSTFGRKWIMAGFIF